VLVGVERAMAERVEHHRAQTMRRLRLPAWEPWEPWARCALDATLSGDLFFGLLSEFRELGLLAKQMNASVNPWGD
jgi:hypothetical protein